MHTYGNARYCYACTYANLFARRAEFGSDFEIGGEMHRLQHGQMGLQIVILHDVGGHPPEPFQIPRLLVDQKFAREATLTGG